ncbi:hypothetical protein CPB85DRAFT_362283 [Mucidula mucida]|nr:hypothetical protein CPB85DRAFT_362283 [Mucidula mucida]
MRFGKFVMLNDKPDKYAFVYNKSPIIAMKVMVENLLGLDDAKATFDVVFWGKVFEAALRSGLSFLDIASTHGDGAPSRVWSALLACAVRDHDCKLSNCDGKDENLFTYSLGPESIPLAIHRYDLEKNGTSRKLSDALSINMRSSFVSWVLHVCFPNISGTMTHLPKDIVLVLTMLQTRSIQHTSSPLGTTPGKSLFRQVLETVEEYVDHAGDFPHHQEVNSTALAALKGVVESEAFGTSTVMALSDEVYAVHILFRGLNRRFELSDRDPSWLTPALFQKIWRVVSVSHESGTVDDSWEVVAHVFTYVSHFDTHLFATEEVYTYLVNQNWLDDISNKFVRLSKSATPAVDGLPYQWCPGYMYVAGTYVDVLYTHAATASKVLDNAREYAKTPAHLSTLSKILLLADCATQDKLWHLAKVVRAGSSCWSKCIEDLTDLITCPAAESEYAHVCGSVFMDVHGNRNIVFHPFKELSSLIATFTTDMTRCQYTPPTYAKPENLKSQPLASNAQVAGDFWTHCLAILCRVSRTMGL